MLSKGTSDRTYLQIKLYEFVNSEEVCSKRSSRQSKWLGADKFGDDQMLLNFLDIVLLTV